ncbi:MAG: hypothetical protein UU12_C0017G0001, partial [Candidatus Woesebacteria bacterium GW2011_GWA2_40_7b]
VLVEIDQAFQIINVIDIGVVRVQLDESIRGGDG